MPESSDYKIGARTREDNNHLRMPAHGTVYKGTLYGFFDDNWAHTNKDEIPLGWRGVDAVSLGKIARTNWKKYTFQLAGHNFRHHVGYGALWFSNSYSFLDKWDFDRIQEIEDSISRPTDARGINIIISGIPLQKLIERYDEVGSAAPHPEKYQGAPGEGMRPLVDLVAFDSVPVSKDSCKTFLLEKKKKKFEAWDSHGAVFHKAGQQKGPRPWVNNLESFDSAFTEDFYAFVRKTDYYFVTESGKLYHAPPAKEGEKSCIMKALWDDAKRPIVAVIEDADRDKVWLFAKDKNAGAKLDLYFEMKDTIRTETFDPSKLRPVNVEGRAKTLLEYLPLISADPKK